MGSVLGGGKSLGDDGESEREVDAWIAEFWRWKSFYPPPFPHPSFSLEAKVLYSIDICDGGER